MKKGELMDPLLGMDHEARELPGPRVHKVQLSSLLALLDSVCILTCTPPLVFCLQFTCTVSRLSFSCYRGISRLIAVFDPSTSTLPTVLSHSHHRQHEGSVRLRACLQCNILTAHAAIILVGGFGTRLRPLVRPRSLCGALSGEPRGSWIRATDWRP